MSGASELRIVSLLASTTEIVCRLGLEEALVGRSHECDFPPSVRSLPVCSHAHVDAEQSSSEINRQVLDRLSAALSIYEVDEARIAQLQPTHVLTQTQCEVCAVSLQDVERALAGRIGNDTHVVTVAPMTFEDVLDDVARIAEALGVPERGNEAVQALRGHCEAIRDRRPADAPRPRVACIEWLDPLMSAGNWVPELVECAGGVNLLGTKGEHSPWLSTQELAAVDPDVLVLMPCGFDLERTVRESPLLWQHDLIARLPAVQRGDVFAVDGNQYFNRSGPRLVDSIEILAEILHPDRYDFGHREHAWKRIGLHE